MVTTPEPPRHLPFVRPRLTAGEIADLLNASALQGERDQPVHELRSLEAAGPNDLAFLSEERLLHAAEASRAGTLVISPGLSIENEGPVRIVVDDARVAFQILSAVFAPPYRALPPGIHPTASIASDAELGEGVCIGPHVTICAGARIGARTTLREGVRVGYDVSIGEDGYLYPNVVVVDGCGLGDRVIVQPSAVIGSDGFGYVFHGGGHQKVSQAGRVLIEDDVEIGAGAAIDRAALEETVIGRGTKIDNLVHVGHGVTVGEHALLVAQVGISGGVTVGKGAILAGQAGIAGHLTIGEGAMIAAQAGVVGNVPPGKTYAGYPARELKQFQRATAASYRVGRLLKKMRALEAELQALRERLED
ncbi:MAG: UDP-3-O-(3-hydroxymyristoyl)glucosamine N-acyltransferase [Planctomycetes bacterium]|nr:UDP-3-O-(3-hydroxymyristoyl)glucosamine N-acyltransferase [Planctomycetota bacterium]